MKTKNMIAASIVVCLVLLAGGTTPASAIIIICRGPDYPPVSVPGVGFSLDDITIPSTLRLTNLFLSQFSDVEPEDVGADEIVVFNAVLTGAANMSDPVPVALTGPVEVKLLGKAGNDTGTFETEIVSMSLTGETPGGPIRLREDPELSSGGQTDIIDLGGGLYHIDSFFDVFVEISLDSGPWTLAADSPLRMEIFPEPATICLLGLGALGIIRRKRATYKTLQ